jgi:uncharacterized protein YjiS (DUF1127 family)
MRAVVCHSFTGPEDLRIGEIDEPKPASDEVLVDLHATSVSFMDRLLVSGGYQMRPPTMDMANSRLRTAGFLKTQWKAFQEWRERARVRSILYAMSDREFKDLGFFRSEIESVVMDDSGKLIRAFPTGIE